MPTVIINDVAYEARLGERLLNIARRNGAHIGFVCDGNGICQTCQCRVLAGAGQLSPPSEAERIWMPERRLAEGHRLACQAALRGPGPVELITKAEELRRQTLDVVAPPRDADRRDYLEPLLDNLVRMSVDQLARYPWNVLATVGRVGVGRFLFPWRDVERWAEDGALVARRMVAGPPRAAALPSPTDPREEAVIEAARSLRRARAAARRSS
ncbi:MAG: 2Fe-2S iron-sulfur cluster-binding protein [Chloroflexi bacterium OHK40]